MNRVMVVVLNVFRPENRTLKESIALSENGYAVSIYAINDGRYKEYEKIDQIDVYRPNLITYRLPKTKFFRLFKFLNLSINLIKESFKYDILHIHEISLLPLAVLIKKLNGIKIVYDCHEYETETHHLRGKKKSLFKFIERKFITHVDETIVVSNSISNEYKRLYNIDRISTVHNTPYYEEYKKSNRFREEFDIKDDIKIYIYQGGLSEGRGIEKYIEIFKILKDHKCCLILMGYGPMEDEIKQIVQESENIYFQEAVSISEIQSYTSSADYGLNVTDNTCLSRYYALPNKLFEYIMARVPVIVSNDYERGSFVRNNNLGFIVDDTSIETIQKMILKSLEYDKSSFFENLDKIASEYNWERESKKLIQLYKKIKGE